MYSESLFANICYHTAGSYMIIAHGLENRSRIQESFLIAEKAKEFAEIAINSIHKLYYHYYPLAEYYAFMGGPKDKIEELRILCLTNISDMNLQININEIFDNYQKKVLLSNSKLQSQYLKEIFATMQNLQDQFNKQQKENLLLQDEIKYLKENYIFQNSTGENDNRNQSLIESILVQVNYLDDKIQENDIPIPPNFKKNFFLVLDCLPTLILNGLISLKTIGKQLNLIVLKETII